MDPKYLFLAISVCVAIFFQVITGASASASSSILETKQGRLEGSTEFSRNRRVYHAFRGIPYAEAPERFQVIHIVALRTLLSICELFWRINILHSPMTLVGLE
jgi:hypothetical protein